MHFVNLSFVYACVRVKIMPEKLLEHVKCQMFPVSIQYVSIHKLVNKTFSKEDTLTLVYQ